jgi:hypothetical protein
VSALPSVSRLDRQRLDAVSRVIRYQGGFSWSTKRCYDCDSRLTAKTGDGRWACPWHWPVVQLEFCA